MATIISMSLFNLTRNMKKKVVITMRPKNLLNMYMHIVLTTSTWLREALIMHITTKRSWPKEVLMDIIITSTWLREALIMHITTKSSWPKKQSTIKNKKSTTRKSSLKEVLMDIITTKRSWPKEELMDIIITSTWLREALIVHITAKRSWPKEVLMDIIITST